MSKNAITIDQIKLACRHVEEMMEANVTENLAIRTLEIFTDIYAKLLKQGNASPHHVNQVSKEFWSVEAKKVEEVTPDLKPKDHLRVEHGTPRRAFARMVLEKYKNQELDDDNMRELVHLYWKLAVITLDEDKKLNNIARSKIFSSPDERWAAAGIMF